MPACVITALAFLCNFCRQRGNFVMLRGSLPRRRWPASNEHGAERVDRVILIVPA
jgi:hypothetical protein